jgi:endonuclease/exonuclease/phosphatase family metal-dependent hydrolase
MLGRRCTVAFATTVGAALLATIAGPASAYDGWNGGYNGGDTGGWNGGTDPGTVTPPPLPVDPGTLGDPIAGSFVTATFNVLGNSHTAGADPRPSGATRMVSSVQILQDNQVDLVGFQELENPQYRAFQRLAGATYQIVIPGKDPRDSIAFRRDRFELVGVDSSVRIPYRQHVRTMPFVTLRDKVTGKKLMVLSVHNVSGQGPKWQQRRAVSVKRELAAIARARAATGLPVVAVGDFNDRSQPFYCQMLTAEMASSSVWWTQPTCELPRRAGIDWIFGSPDVRFTGYLKLDGGIVDQATDHPVVLARTLL